MPIRHIQIKKSAFISCRTSFFLFFIFYLSFLNSGIAQQPFLETVSIFGHYSYVYRNGQPGVTNVFYFTAVNKYSGLAINEWSIAVTNKNNTSDWAKIWFDGTNIFTLETDAGNLPFGKTNAFAIYGYVYPGRFYIPESQNSVHIFLPWMALHLSPKELVNSFQQNGTIEMPWPWGNTRYSLLGYGFKWVIESSEDDQILKKIDIVRDSTLDCKTEEEELRRPLLEYPFSMSTRESILQMLETRKSITNGFTRCSYECLQTFHTNGLTIPAMVKFAEYWPVVEGSRIVYEIQLELDRVSLNGQMPDLIPNFQSSVFDFRYARTNSRTKYNYARYTLEAGQSFRSANDPELLAEADHWLKHGPSYESYKSKRAIILIGMLLVTIIFVGLLAFRSKSKKRH